MKLAAGLLVILECVACLAISAAQQTTMPVGRCPELPTPGNGRNSNECKGTTKVGDVCTFSCFDGYDLRGDYEHKCTEGFKWEPPHPPTCVNTCPRLEDLEHGRMEGKCNGTAEVDETCTFHCINTKRIKGSSVLKCTKELKWDNPPPTCGGCSTINLHFLTFTLTTFGLLWRF